MATQAELDIDTPPELELKASQLDPSTIGVYCKKGIRQAARFGPLLGERLQDIPEDTNHEFLLKVVDKDSKELVFYVDASDTNTSNWMRYVQGCKTPKEQNVMPQRDGSDIYLIATKDLSKGSEFLVSFEEPVKTSKQDTVKDENIKTILICWGEGQQTPTKKKGKSPNSRKTQKDIEKEENNEEEKDEEREEESDSAGEEFNGDEEDGSSVKEEGKYQFELRPIHTIKSRLGRKVFQCDICSGVYRHAFSLKRHYIRNHINYRFVSKADLLNCQINADAHVTEGNSEKCEKIEKGEQDNSSSPKSNAASSEKCENREDSDNNAKNEDENNENNVKMDKIEENSKKSEKSHLTNDAKSDFKNDTKTDTENDINDKSTSSDKENSETLQDATASNTDSNIKENTDSKVDNTVEQENANSEHSETSPNSSDTSVRFPGLFRCNVCGQLFDTVGLLKTHISHHPDVPNMKAYSCDSCDMKFTHKQNLMRHQAVHTGAKPYLCKFCGKKFPTATNQKRHERIHLGRRISCEFCSSSFTQSGDLKKHIRKLHPECFHECAFCGKYYGSEMTLEEHLVTHEETPTSNLEEATRRRHAFKVNMEQDMAESMRLAEQRPGFKYACTVCKKRFHDYANMCRHRRLAHQRHLLMTKRTGKLDDEEVLPVNDVSNHQAEFDPHSYFFANVARNIAENLKYFVEGGQDNLNNPDMHIKWKVDDDVKSQKSKTATPEVPANACANYSVYNFPKGFEPQSNFHKSVDQKEVTEKAEKGNDQEKEIPTGEPEKDGGLPDKDQKEEGSTQSKNQNNGSPSPKAFVLSVPSYHVHLKTKEKSRSPTDLSKTNSHGNTKVSEKMDIEIKKEPTTDFGDDTEKVSESHNGNSVSSSPQSTESSSPQSTESKDLKNKSGGRKSPAKASADNTDQNIIAKRSESPISIPKIRICSICHCIFHKADLFQTHMKSRHKIDVDTDDTLPTNLTANSAQTNAVSYTVTSQQNAAVTSPTRSSVTTPPKTPLRSPPIPFATYQTKPWDGAVAAIDLSNTTTEAQMYDFNGALDLTSPTKKSPPGLSMVNAEYYHTSEYNMDYNHGTANANINPNSTAYYNGLDNTYNKYTCGVCSEDYPGLEALQAHQRTSHANVTQDQLNLMGDFNSNWTLKPNSVGLLNVCTSQIPTAEDYASANVKYTCTKCKAEFVQIGDLHHHIVECAVDYFVSSKPYQPKSRLKFAKGLGWVSSRHNRKMLESKAKANQVKKKVKRALLKTIMTHQSEIDAEFELLPRRRSLELLYNPSKHVRRREMTEVLDMHRCRGCGFRFATISLLERHIKVCTQKDRIKELQVMKPSLRGANSLNSLNKRHMCHYCKKNFTYIGGLKKHIFDICGVRKQLKEENGKLEQSWEDSIVAMLLARDAAQEEENYERNTRRKRGRRKNHRWGYGKKKKTGDPNIDDNEEKDDDNEEKDDDNEEKDDDNDDDNDDNRDDESVASLVSKGSIADSVSESVGESVTSAKTDTSNTNVINDYDDNDDNDDNLNDDDDYDDDDDEDSTSGALVIDMKEEHEANEEQEEEEEEEEEEKSSYEKRGLEHKLQNQINGKISTVSHKSPNDKVSGKVSPGVIRAHVEHLQHKDSVKQHKDGVKQHKDGVKQHKDSVKQPLKQPQRYNTDSKEKDAVKKDAVKKDASNDERSLVVPSTELPDNSQLNASKAELDKPQKPSSAALLTNSNDSAMKKHADESPETCSKNMAARALIDLQSSDAKPVPAPKSTAGTANTTATPTITYSTLKVPDISARTFRQTVPKTPKKGKATEAKSPKGKSPAKQKSIPNDDSSGSSSSGKAAESVQATASQATEYVTCITSKAVSKTGLTVPDTVESPESGDNAESPESGDNAPSATSKGRKESAKRKGEDSANVVPIKKTLTRSKSRNATEKCEAKAAISENSTTEDAPVVTSTSQKDTQNVATNASKVDNANSIRIKTGSKVTAVTLTSPKVTTAAMKLIVPSPGRVSAAAGRRSSATVSATKTKQVVGSNPVNSNATNSKDNAADSKKDKGATKDDKNSKECKDTKGTAMSNAKDTKEKASPPATKAAKKRTQNKNSKNAVSDTVESPNIANTQESPPKKPAKKGAKGTRANAGKNAKEDVKTPTPAKKTTKRTNSTTVTPDPTPPPSPAKKTPKRRSTRSS